LQTTFATQLFNSGEVSETINKYKISTVVVSLVIYFTASMLVWLADKIGTWREQIADHVLSIWKDFVKKVKGGKGEARNYGKKADGGV
jgi:hypothetical protein